MDKKVLVTGTSARADLLQPLRDAGFTIANPTGLLSEEELKSSLVNATAYLLGGDEIATRAALSTAKQLRVIAFLGVGYESYIDVQAARDLGIPITNTPGTLTQSVAEFTIGQTLNVVRKLSAYGQIARDAGAPEGLEQKTHELKARRIGIIGLGAIGTRIAEILTQGFSCKVAYWSRTRKLAEETRLGIAYRQLDELLRTTDILILMTPGNATTHGLIGSAEIAKLPRGAIIVNTARPDIIDASALLAGLESGQIGSAALDPLYEEQDAIRAALLKLPLDKLVTTRHIASLTHEARDGMTIKAVQSILNIVNTGSDQHIVGR